MDGAMYARMVRLWTAGTRIACFLAVVMPFSALARTILVPTQPVSPYLDTEVSTNFALHAGRTDTWGFDLRIQIAGTPTNDLEVAFGVDANTNGVLEVEEIETVYGWRGGRYFVENVPEWDRIETEAATNALCGVLEVSLQNSSSAVPRRFAATCGGDAAFASLAATPHPSSDIAPQSSLRSGDIPAWLFRREWDMVRVVRRGTGIPSEWVRCDIEYQSFSIRLR